MTPAEQVQAWNAAHAAGTRIIVRPLGFDAFHTITDGPAIVIRGRAYLKISGSAYVPLHQVTAKADQTAAA